MNIAYNYCTKGNEKEPRKILDVYDEKQKKIYQANGKIAGEFICTKIEKWCSYFYTDGKAIYLWDISEVKLYEKPKLLSELGLKRPPRSWHYVKESG